MKPVNCGDFVWSIFFIKACMGFRKLDGFAFPDGNDAARFRDLCVFVCVRLSMASTCVLGLEDVEICVCSCRAGCGEGGWG